MKSSRHIHFVLQTGALSLATLVGLGAVATNAQSVPSLQATSSPSTSATSIPAGSSPSNAPSGSPTSQPATGETTPKESEGVIKDADRATPEPNPLSTTEASKETPAPEPSAHNKLLNDVPVALDVQAPAFMRPGEVLEGVVTNIPDGNHVTAELASESGEKVLSCEVDVVEDISKVTCDVPENYDGGTYVLRVHLLNERNQPVVVGGKEVVDISQTVKIADLPADYSPRIIAQYPVMAAGYVMPITGTGYEKNSQVTISSVGANGNPVSSATFALATGSKTPTVEDLRNSVGTLTVSTDENGEFKAYMVLSPYTTSGVVNMVAHDEKNNISTSDSVIVLGESVAEINTSVESIEANKAVEIEIEGDKFAPSYTQYPVALQLVRGDEVILSEDINLLPPLADSLWSSFNGVVLTLPEGLSAGDYQIQAVVPDYENIPAEVRGRPLATRNLTVTEKQLVEQPSSESPAPLPSVDSPVLIPSTEETVPTSELPTLEPVPVESDGVKTTEDSQAEHGAETSATPVPVDATEEEETAVAVRTAPYITQKQETPEPAESPLDQNPVWLQASSIKPDDPRVEKESNQQLKSSVLQAQGSKNAESRFDPSAGTDVSQSEGGPSESVVVNVDKSTLWWPIVLLIAVALGVGIFTGSFISRSTRKNDAG